MPTPPEGYREELERTDALPRLDLNVLAEATPINSDLLTRTDSWDVEALQDQDPHWQEQFAVIGTEGVATKAETANLHRDEDESGEMLTPLELGLSEISADAVSPPAIDEPTNNDEAQAVQHIAASLEQEIVLFAEEHAGGRPVGSIESPLEKAQAVSKLTELASLLDTQQTPPSVASSSDSSSDEGITWVDVPQDYMPTTLAEGAQHLRRLLEQEQEDSSIQARSLALHLMGGESTAVARTDVASLELNQQTLVEALFSKTQHEQQADLLSARQTIEEMRASNTLLQQAVTTAQQRVEFLKAEIERHTEIARTHDSQLATSIEELTSRRLVMRELERVIQSRDEVIAGLRAELDAVRVELQTAKEERGIMAINLSKTRERAKMLRDQLQEKNALLQSLHADPAEPTQTLARASGEALATDLPERMLVPIDHAGQNIPLDRPMMIVGRTSQQTDICIHSSLISRRHARLIVTSEAVVVEDLNSTNGCFVNNRRIQKKMVREGDIVTLADMKYRLSQPHPQGMRTD